MAPNVQSRHVDSSCHYNSNVSIDTLRIFVSHSLSECLFLLSRPEYAQISFRQCPQDIVRFNTFFRISDIYSCTSTCTIYELSIDRVEFILSHTTSLSLVVDHCIHHFCINTVFNSAIEQSRLEWNRQSLTFHSPFNLDITLSDQSVTILSIDQRYANDRLTTYSCS